MKTVFLDTNVVVDLLQKRDVIVTRNIKDFSESKINVMSPDEFLSDFE